MKDVEIYHLDDLEVKREFGMDIKVCELLVRHFDNKVTLEYVVLDPNTEFKPHYHDQSDALVLILRGHGYITDASKRKYSIKEGTLAYFPAKTRHGFITEEEHIHLISIQSPPIKNLQTGHIDFIE